MPDKYIPYTLNDVNKSSARKLFTVISTFAGGGGSSTGYRLAGGDVLAINEFVAEAIATYSANFPDTKIIPEDIKKLTGSDFLQATNLAVGELDILDGSPPCVAFSIASGAKGGAASKWNKEKTYSDHKKVTGIEDLFHEYIRVAKDIQPKIIIAENVPGILVKNPKIYQKLLSFIKGFESISPGYTMIYRVLNATHYGVPQARRRVFFVGIRNDIIKKLNLQEYHLHSLFPTPSTPQGVSIFSAIHDIKNDQAEIEQLRAHVINSFQKKYIDTMPHNPQKAIKPSALSGEYRKVGEYNKATCFSMVRPAPHLPCPTLTQMGQKMAASGVLHYEDNRKLTILEMKRIMSLPEDFILTGKFDHQAERIGRMVAPKMMSAIASNIYETILKPYKEQQND